MPVPTETPYSTLYAVWTVQMEALTTEGPARLFEKGAVQQLSGSFPTLRVRESRSPFPSIASPHGLKDTPCSVAS